MKKVVLVGMIAGAQLVGATMASRILAQKASTPSHRRSFAAWSRRYCSIVGAPRLRPGHAPGTWRG